MSTSEGINTVSSEKESGENWDNKNGNIVLATVLTAQWCLSKPAVKEADTLHTNLLDIWLESIKIWYICTITFK